MSTPMPPDLRVLCRKLTSIPPAQLPRALPSLIRHVIRCKDCLAAPHDQKLKTNASESAVLVHTLKTTITNTLLNGRSREGRFAAIGLIKAIIDVGGWEALRGSEPWVQGLLSIIQKGDPTASKELAVVTLTRIYTLLNPYQTLVREIATPTLPAFITACIQLLKAPAIDQAQAQSLQFIETVCDAISTLIPLYPTTLRPSSAQLKSAVWKYLVPSAADDVLVPGSLQQAARRLVITIHFVAAKSGGSDEWTKLVSSVASELQSTLDQVFRAVDESWEPAGGQSRPRVDFGGEPHRSGGPAPDGFPAWSGLHAGAERTIGLFGYLADSLRYPTKSAVAIPITTLMDVVSRVCLVARISPKTQTWDQSLQTNAAIGRDEKDELWSLIPDIHIAAMQLLLVLTQRLGGNTLSFIPETLDHLTRVFKSGISVAGVRTTGYVVFKELLSVAGPTLSKPSVDMLDPIVGACCRDLQQHAGYLKSTDKPNTVNGDNKKNGIIANADLFLHPQAANTETATTLDPDHQDAANALLPVLLSSLPQQHLRPTLRGLLEKTAILTSNRDAMLASVLHPYKDQRGRVYPSILPHLTQQYPHDQGLEMLRTNIRTIGLQDRASPSELDHEHELDNDEYVEEAEDNTNREEEQLAAPQPIDSTVTFSSLSKMEMDIPLKSDNPFSIGDAQKSPEVQTFQEHKTVQVIHSKRKHEDPSESSSKRQELSPPPPQSASSKEPPISSVNAAKDAEEESDDESVHLNMELEEDEDEDEDDEE
ncbi:hypothetical protein S40288_01066 [Stachybotrys chartarum IBT 40288]|nr:hypothetical protein S40288_01066 [Stachybotrys chartarum IBT 40288]